MDDTYYVLLIVEGDEEEAFFDIVKEKGLNKNILLECINAGGFGNIGAYYQSYRSLDLYDAVLCVYDVDYRHNERGSPFNIVQNELMSIHGKKEMVDAVSFCTNPNILQFYLLGCNTLTNVAMNKTSKRGNSNLIHTYWPEIAKPKTNEKGQNATSYYDAEEWQIKIIKDSFIYDTYSYETILNNSSVLTTNYTLSKQPGSNLRPLLIALKEGNVDFFKRIENIICGNGNREE